MAMNLTIYLFLLEVTSTKTLADGTTVPDGYRVVYAIPPNHPYYNELKVLDGTEPMIIILWQAKAGLAGVMTMNLQLN